MKKISFEDLEDLSNESVGEFDFDVNVEKEGDVRVNVDRNYDFSKRICTCDTEYIQQDGEKDEVFSEIMYRVQHNNNYNKPLAFLIDGPPGSGKTLFFENLSETLNAPLFTLQGREDISSSDIIGSLTSEGGDIWWEDSTVSKALLSSQEQLTICLIDEFNRMRSSDRAILYSFLDKRNKISIGVRGDEIVRGNPDNLIIGATTNTGRGHMVNNIDDAEARRMGSHINIDHLGLSSPKEEAELVSSKSDFDKDLAYLFVRASNYMREVSKEKTSSNIGVPTDSVVQWSRASRAYDMCDLEKPITKAAKRKVINPYYDNNTSNMEDIIIEVISTTFGDNETTDKKKLLEKCEEDNLIEYADNINYNSDEEEEPENEEEERLPA